MQYAYSSKQPHPPKRYVSRYFVSGLGDFLLLQHRKEDRVAAVGDKGGRASDRASERNQRSVLAAASDEGELDEEVGDAGSPHNQGAVAGVRVVRDACLAEAIFLVRTQLLVDCRASGA